MSIPSPMKPQWFQILLALAEGERHGYGIQRAVLKQTEGKLRLWPAMLYRSLATLADEGLIESVDHPENEPEDQRRQYYALTPAGKERLRAEAEMLAAWVDTVRNESKGWEVV